MAQARTGKARLGEPTLTASDWAEAALQLIAEKGLGALTISALAARLGATKGSFYWHFKGRDELLAAALARWERSVGEIIRSLDAIPDHRRRLELILDAASQPPRSRSLYAALAEAAEDPVVRKVLQRVASLRIDYLEVCYRGLGLAAASARAHAVLAYAAYRGLLQLAHEAPGSLPAEWASYAALTRQTFLPEASAETKTAEARDALTSAALGRPHFVLGVDRGEGDLGFEERGHVAQRDLQRSQLRRVEVDLVVGGVGEVLHDGAAARREARVDPLGDLVDVVAPAGPRLAGHAVVGGDGDGEAPGAGLALDDLERARDLAIELGHLLLDLRRGRPVGMADVVGALQVDEHEIGDLVGADAAPPRGRRRARHLRSAGTAPSARNFVGLAMSWPIHVPPASVQ